MRNPYRAFVSGYVRLLKKGASLPLGGLPPSRRPKRRDNAPRVLLFSPHPDDECITGALPLRLLREAGMDVVNVAVTQGSKKERRAERFVELRHACDYLGFELIQTVEGGLEKINPKGRDSDPANWSAAVSVVSGFIAAQRPRIIFLPHLGDANRSHAGTHLLVMDALEKMGPAFSGFVVETEFWAALPSPNLMVESSVRDVADLVAATSFHAGEVRRNPYHLSLPAWMQDNVRRGAELVGGQGGVAPDFVFATLYRVGMWSGGKITSVGEGGRLISRHDDSKSLFA